MKLEVWNSRAAVSFILGVFSVLYPMSFLFKPERRQLKTHLFILTLLLTLEGETHLNMDRCFLWFAICLSLVSLVSAAFNAGALVQPPVPEFYVATSGCICGCSGLPTLV